MANQEHVDILKQGVEVWNKWREEHPKIRPDLSDVSLVGANLRGANLNHVDLSYAILTGANLINANLSDTNLSDADLTGANLSYANLYGADLSYADLSYTVLTHTDLNRAQVGFTTFGNVDLSVVKELDTVWHNGPSTIGIDTVYRSQGNIPENFLKGAGVPNTMIDYMRSLIGKPFDFYSCFISYSSKDQDFAQQLYADLQSNGVRCWFAREDMDVGDKIRPRIDETIRLYDKLLVVLSEHSIKSNWVAYEVEKALDKEPEGIPNVLFPIRLDNAVLICETQWAKDIQRTRYIGDFERWKEHDEYQKSFKRLLRALKAE